MALEAGWLTRHERGVITAALRTYTDAQKHKSRTASQTETRGHATANAYVADDLLRQLAGQ